MRLILTVMRDAKEIEKFALDAPKQATFGRLAGTGFADKQYHDETLSRHHFRIQPSGDQWVLQDLKSRNGTKVGGQKVGTVALQHGDIILAGKLTFLVELPGAKASNSHQTNTVSELDPDGAFEPAVRAKRGELRMTCSMEAGESGQVFFSGDLGKLKSAAELALALKQKRPFQHVWLVIDQTRLPGPLPESLSKNSVAIVDWLNPHYTEEVSPRLVDIQELAFPDWEKTVAESWGQDTLYVIFSDQSQEELLSALRKACRHGSAISGALWPSVLSYMLLKSKTDQTHQLMASCSAILMEFADLPDHWQLIGPETLRERLAKMGIASGAPVVDTATQSGS